MTRRRRLAHRPREGDRTEGRGAVQEQHRVRAGGARTSRGSARGRALFGRSHRVLPEVPAVAGTRGAVLLRLRRAAEALPLLSFAENGATSKRNLAYSKALMAGALAAVGRGDEARRKLAEARQLDPACDLIPRAEADIAAGPIAARAGARRWVSRRRRTRARALALRHWRRDARILAFVVCVLVLERLGFSMSATVIGIVLSIAPELSGAAALAAYGLSAALMYALGRMPPDLMGRPPGSGAPLYALAMGLAACWLVTRHRRLVAPPPSRTPIVLGWILAGLAILSLFPDLFRCRGSGSPLARHAAARNHLSGVPGLIALAALLMSRPRRAGRRLAAAPVALALLALAGGSSWYLNRVVLADVRRAARRSPGPDRSPAKALRSVALTGPAHDPAVSPGGRAFWCRVVASAPAGGGAPKPAGFAAARRRLRRARRRSSRNHRRVHRRRAAALAARPRQPRRPRASSSRCVRSGSRRRSGRRISRASNIHDATLRIERGTGTVFIQVDVQDASPIVLSHERSTPTTAIVRASAPPPRARPSARHPAVRGRLERNPDLTRDPSSTSAELWWRGATRSAASYRGAVSSIASTPRPGRRPCGA